MLKTCAISLIFFAKLSNMFISYLIDGGTRTPETLTWNIHTEDSSGNQPLNQAPISFAGIVLSDKNAKNQQDAPKSISNYGMNWIKWVLYISLEAGQN